MGKVVFHPITRQLIELQAENKQLRETQQAQQFVLGWMLARLCPEDSRLLLAAQANELEPTGRYREHVALFDELREEVALWLAQWSSANTPQR